MTVSSPSSLLAALLCHLFVPVYALSVTLTGQTLMLGDVTYYLPATPFTTVSVPKLAGTQSPGGLVPATVVSVGAGNDSIESLGGIVREFAADDVWSTGFLEGRCMTELSLMPLVQPQAKITPWIETKTEEASIFANSKKRTA